MHRSYFYRRDSNVPLIHKSNGDERSLTTLLTDNREDLVNLKALRGKLI